MGDYSFERKSPDAALVAGDYGQAFQSMGDALSEAGGKVKKASPTDGFVEAVFRYGINPWGLRVTAQFRDLGEGKFEVRVGGHFKDAFDTTGKASAKAVDALDRFERRLSIADSRQSLESVPPPLVGSPSAEHRGKSKTAAALLALLLAGLGAHKFYLGSWGWGLVYIGAWGFGFLSGAVLLSYAVIVVSVIEAIKFFRLARTDFDAKYNFGVVAPFKW